MSRPTSHVGELFGPTLYIIAVFGLDGILDGTGSRIVDTQNGALHKLDLTGCVTSQSAAAAAALEAPSSRSPGSLSLAPRFCRGGLTSSVGRIHTTGDTKCGSRVVRMATVRVMMTSIGGVGFSQAVTGGRSHGRDISLVGVVERARAGEQTMSSLFLCLAVLDGRKTELALMFSLGRF